MIIVGINTVEYGSTGMIMREVAEAARRRGHKVYTASSRGVDSREAGIENHIFISDNRTRRKSVLWDRLSGKLGHHAKKETKAFLQELDKLNPDIIHLHNLHGSYINLPMLFKYIAKNKIKVVWTLHDCSALTGKCVYFTAAGCDRWKDGCGNCPQLKAYPVAYRDKTARLWREKKDWYAAIEHMTIVTPSDWMAGLARQSILNTKDIRTIHSGINLQTFVPTEGDFRQRYGIEDKFIVLGVAANWGYRKGLDVMNTLAEHLPQDYKVVLVGTDDQVDKELNENIISIHKTNSARELAEIYTAADVFANPTREEVLGLVNIEALACGTPVVVFKTGGCPEIINDKCGIVVNADDLIAMKSAIQDIKTTRRFKPEDCILRARYFDKYQKYDQYVDGYEDLL